MDWFDDVLDFLDLKSVIIQDDHAVKYCLLKFYTQEGLNRSKNIYLFSQQGYAMLCKLLKSDLAKRIYKQMVREYFKMIEIQQNEESHREILTKRNDGEAEKYCLQGKLTEIIVEGLKQNREEMQQNRHEINQIHLELREVKERLLAIERCISSKRNNSRKTTKK